MSEATTPFPDFLASKASVPRQLSLPMRPLKVSLAAAIALVGTYGVLSERQYLSTNDAVVSSYVLDVRTPIEGTLQGAPATAGDVVQAGAPLAEISNELNEHQHLDDLQLRQQAAQAAADSLLRERGMLEALQARMLSRAAVYRAAVGTRLEEDAEAARLTLLAKQASLEQANAEAQRGARLTEWGVASRASAEKLASTQSVLAAEVRSQQAALGALEAEKAALKQGVLAAPGTNNDVAYSVQRADELAFKLAENARDLQAAQTQAREASAAVEGELDRTQMLRRSELRAPSAGLIWKLNAVNGEHVAAGAPVLSLVDCNSQFLLAQVPQDRASSILLKGRAEIKLTGDTVQRFGTVMTVSSDAQRNLDGKLAATPAHKLMGDLATVVLRMDAPVGSGAQPCLVGRTARVRLPTAPTNLVSLWLSKRL